MEIINPKAAFLTNLEVMLMLRAEKGNKPQTQQKGLRNLATITYETLQWLEDSVCKEQTKETVTAFLVAMAPYGLTQRECQQLINDPPSSTLHIQLMIEKFDERFTEEQVNEIIAHAAKLRNPVDAPGAEKANK